MFYYVQILITASNLTCNAFLVFLLNIGYNPVHTAKGVTLIKILKISQRYKEVFLIYNLFCQKKYEVLLSKMTITAYDEQTVQDWNLKFKIEFLLYP